MLVVRFSDCVISLPQTRRCHEWVDVGWSDLRDQRWKSRWCAHIGARQRFEWRGYSRDGGRAALLQMTHCSHYYSLPKMPCDGSSSPLIDVFQLYSQLLGYLHSLFTLLTYCHSLLTATPYLLPLLTCLWQRLYHCFENK